jgi:putative redox protein
MGIKRAPILTAKATIGTSHYQSIVNVDHHVIVSDEPVDAGGMGSGVNPQGLLLSSVGSCTVITLRMYIDRKMWPVKEIGVDLELFDIDGEYVIEKQLYFNGELNDEQKKRLVQIADACPINKMLNKGIRTETQLK